MSMTVGATWTAEVSVPGEAGPFRAQVQAPEHAPRFSAPAEGAVTGFLVDLKSREVRFDGDDPRNCASSSLSLDIGGGSMTSANVQVIQIGGSSGQMTPEQKAKLERVMGMLGGESGGLGAAFAEIESRMQVTSNDGAAYGGPKWDVPTHCPNCGALVDQATASYQDDPRCAFCQEAIPVTAHMAAPGIAGGGAAFPDAGGGTQAIDRSHDHPGTLTRVLAEGDPVQATLMSAALMPDVHNSAGEDVMSLTLKVVPPGGGSPYLTKVGTHVPGEARHLLIPGTVLPAKVIADEPKFVAIDWQSAVGGG